MKKVFALSSFIFIFLVCFAQKSDPILMTIGGKNVTKSEFEYIWNKNKINTEAEKISLDDYIDLFVNFKLKVRAAEALGLDTTASFLTELNGYRTQLTPPFFQDSVAEEAFFRKSYERSKQFAEISNIMITCLPNATPEDTLIAYSKIMEIYNRCNAGADFANQAKLYSQDDLASTGGYIGFITGIRYLLPLENAAFETPVNAVSKPFRTQFGYHLVKVISRHEAKGMYRAAHIMKRCLDNASLEEKAAAKDSIFKWYNALMDGVDFAVIAKSSSDDSNSAPGGGEYPMTGAGAFPYEYESAVYNLKVGEISKPFQSPQGWHIVKALEFAPNASYETMRSQIKSYINTNDMRMAFIDDQVNLKRLQKFAYQLDKSVYEKLIMAYDDIRLRKNSTQMDLLLKTNPNLFTLNGVGIPVSQFCSEVDSKPENLNDVAATLAQYSKRLAKEIVDANLEAENPEFRHLMQEYRDGILLFDLSSKVVWDKVSNDEKGLEAFFLSNKQNYNWKDPRYKGVVVLCSTKAVANKAKTMIKKLPLDSIPVVLRRTFNSDTVSVVKVERGLYKKGDNAQIDHFVFGQPQPEADKKYPIVLLKGKKLKNAPETYKDVRGTVVEDYQNLLEANWLKQLREKYKVIINKDVLQTVNKN